jgi:hypothetical protein
MKTIKKIVNDIEKLENDFSLFNARLMEFAKSTKKEKLDRKLLKRYIETLKSYKKSVTQYKNDLQNLDDIKEEYQAQKKLMLFRIDKLEKLFNTNISKLNLILESVDIKEEKYKNNTEFKSRTELVEMKRNVYDFYNNYNTFLEFQKKYNIEIDLDDNFEEKKEKELSSLDIIKQEKKYIEELNEIFY